MFSVSRREPELCRRRLSLLQVHFLGEKGALTCEGGTETLLLEGFCFVRPLRSTSTKYYTE